MALTRPRAAQIYDIDYKQATRVVTVANVTLSGGAPSSVDGVNLNLKDRVLVTGQTAGAENGIYYVTTLGTGANGTWTRSLDTDATGELLAGTVVMVTEGLIYADTQWKLTTNDPITIGVTALTFVQNYSANSIASGNSNVVVLTNSSVTISSAGSANVLKVDSGLVTIAGNLIPASNVTYSLGNTTNRFSNLWLSNTTIYIGNVTVGATATTLTVNGANVVTGDANGNISSGNILNTGTISSTGNITTAGYFLGNVACASGIYASRIFNGNSEVNISASGSNVNISVSGTSNVVVVTTTGLNVTGTASASGNITGGNILTAGLVSATGNATAGNVLTSGVVSATANITGGNVLTAGLISATSTITSAANITGGNILTGGLMSSTGNATHGNVLTSGVVSATANVTGGNLLTAGLISATSTITSSANITGANLITAGLLSVTGAAYTGNIFTSGGISITGNTITSSGATLTIDPNGSGSVDGNVVIAGNLSVQGNVTYIDSNVITTNEKSITLGNNQNTGTALDGAGIDIGNNNLAYWRFNNATTSWQSNIGITPAANATLNLGGTSNYWNVIYGTTSTTTGNVVAGNLSTAGLVTATGNITGGNVLTAGLISATSTITSSANITGGNLLTSGLISATSTITSSANITGANILTGGLVSATGNATAGNVLTSGQVSATGNIYGGNVLYGAGVVSGTGNITGNVITATTVNSTTVSASGNVTGANILTGGQVSATGNVIGGNVTTVGLVSATGNVIGGNISTTGNVTGNYFLGNVACASGIYATKIFNGNSEANIGTANGNANISIGGVSNVVVVTTTGILVTGVTSASGNITGGNVLTAGLVSATANITGGNVLTAGAMSSTGNATHGNILTAGLVSATGNVTGNYFNGNGSALTGINSFSNIAVTGGSFIAANTISTLLTLVAGNNIVLTANNTSKSLQIDYSASGGTSIFATGGDMGTVVEAVSSSEDLGNVTTASTTSYDLGVLGVQGVVSNSDIVNYQITGNKFANNITISTTGNITGANIALTSSTGDVRGWWNGSGNAVSVNSQETAPTSVIFNDAGTAGTIMYIVGSNKAIYQYSVSTAWKANTASYASISANVAAQDTSPQAIRFNATNTTLYMLGATNKTVYQYNVTYSNIATLSYASLSISVAGQESSPTAMTFGNSFSKMYVVGTANTSVYQYSLGTAGNVATAVYNAPGSLSISAQDTSPSGIEFSSDGTTMYLLGAATDSVYQYSMTSAWDITTASYTGYKFPIGSQEPSPKGLYRNETAQMAYLVGNGTGPGTVWQYNIGNGTVATSNSLYYSNSITVGANVYVSGNITQNGALVATQAQVIAFGLAF